MRSQFLTCIAVVTLSLYPRVGSEARAANPTGKAPKGKASAKAKAVDKKTPTELHADDKSMKKQMQWEDKVMGPDSTRADLARVARAHALNEKAIKDRDAQAAREAASPPPPVVAKSATKRAEVALPSVSDGAKTTDNDNARPHEISPKLASDEAKAPPPAVKPADDKFIEKLLRDEQESSASRKKASSASDRDLDRLLAGANEKRAGRRDDVDKLLKNADSGPAMPAPRAPSALPAWTQQPDISPSPPVAAAVPVAAPVASKPQKKSDSVIRVVQGAASGVAPANTSTSVATAEPSRAGRSSRTASGRSTAASNTNTWNDPFADSSGNTPSATTLRKAVASHPAAASSEWNDPFADKAETKTTRRSSSGSSAGGAPASAAPAKRGDKAGDPAAHPAGWKDPFTKASAAPQAPVAMRELGRTENVRWELASHHSAPKVAAAETHQGWGVLKKRAR